MPCYLLSYHAYGSWLPDRSKGFVHWARRYQPQDLQLADCYQAKMSETEAVFEDNLQLAIIDELQIAAGFQRFDLRDVATETTHVHIVISWKDTRTKDQLSRSVKTSLTRRLQKESGRRKTLVKGGSKERVKDLEHFEYLRRIYLPKHRGWKWHEGRGLYR